MSTKEPSALTAALSSPAFVTKGGGLAMHVANRHVARWAPEVGEPGANNIRPLRNLGFVDRLVSPWIESAQRSTSMRMFSQYLHNGVGERQTNTVSWVFPRPWFQDELDWMAAARTVGQQSAMGSPSSAPQMFTTRGTYVAPVQQQSQLALPSALYEYVAPSLSIAKPDPSGSSVNDAYSPLVPLASMQAAHVMARAVAPIMGAQHGAAAAARMSPGLRAVLTSMLARSAVATSDEMIPSRVSSYAPELVTPPSPSRADAPVAAGGSYESTQSTQVADQYAEQRTHIVELQRVARVAAEREYVAREAQRQAPATEAARAADPRVGEVRAAEVRAVEQRQADLQQRATEVAVQRGAERTAEVVRREADRAAADTERARIEERISQRIAERTTQQEAQRLHATSRDAAARDARTAPMPSAPVAPEARAVENRVATEIAAAVAALPPELASMVAAGIGSRPERAVQAIAELGEALRAVELIARNNAAGGAIESTRGPRLVMPTGLGGLVATVERTTGGQQARVPAAFALPAAAPMGAIGATATAAPQARREMRTPAMHFLAAPNAPAASSGPAPSSALGAATAMTPAALSHVAWSDRWLARFAGAKTQSLDVFSAANASPEMRLEMLAAAAPGTVFVAPFFDDRPRDMPAIVGDSGVPRGASSEPLPTLRHAAPSTPVTRFADDAETPDDVFLAIASAANRQRVASASSSATVAAAPTAATAMTFDRETLADLVAQSAPSSPGAGLSAGLASSPFAPALRHVLPLGTAPTFDVRALFGGGIGATYLAGLLASHTDEISVASQTLPTWATWGQSPMSAFAPTAGDAEMPMRDVADWSPTYVAPEAARVDAATDAGTFAPDTAVAEAIAEHNAPLTTLRSALLSWDVETIAAQSGAPVETRVSPATTSYSTAPLARSIIDSMTLPMLAETAALRDVGALDIAGMSTQASSYAAPGMIADRAQSWSIAQERSTSDLAFDFVSPELVLAARVYGLGPAEAAQAARLATAGPGQLTAMAGAVDRTFVQALAIESERRGERMRSLTTAFPIAADGGVRPSSQPASTSTSTAMARGDEATSSYGDDAAPMPAATTSMFGVQRRMPRGAFLWPAATTAALGLNAAAPDGELSMSVAALELLAAHAVAELGTYAALGEHPMFAGAAGSDDVAGVPAARRAGGMPVASGGEATEADVLASAEAMVPISRKDKFQALYLALGQSPSGRNWSPAARAARALALAGRGEESVSARERASVVWEVLPMVYGMGDEPGETLSTGDAAGRMVRRREELRALDAVFVDGRPGLGALSTRAGEALGSYVAPSGFSSPTGSAASGASSSSRSGGEGAVMRAPTAAQELVQTGRPSGRHGGGELEIPSWFEAAARKMLEDRSSVSDGISLADLTLVQSAAPQQVAASSRHDGASTASVAPAPSAAAGAESEKIDIDKLANEVYREILVLMDIARARNGEPYL